MFLGDADDPTPHDVRRVRLRVCGTRLAGGSLRMRLAGRQRRELLASAFLDAVETIAGECGPTDELVAAEVRQEFSRRVRLSGMAGPLVMLLLSIAWDILWAWWQRRQREGSPC